MNKYLLAVLLSSVASFALSKTYPTLDSQCDGLPQVAVGSVSGTCVGLLAGKDVGFVKPRKVLEVTGKTQLLVTDMGGWGDYRGTLWLLDFYTPKGFKGEYRAYSLLTKLRLPHEIKTDGSGWYYLGEAHQITRFKLEGKTLIEQETIVEDLPFVPNEYLHPLTTFVFNQDNDLIVNVGSASDQCEQATSTRVCEEAERVGLRHYPFNSATKRWSQNWSMYATGLRNSMALVAHNSGTILQAENSSDIKDAEEPYEEINVVLPGKFYGWPYCLNRQFNQDAFENGCSRPNYQEPLSLMPPHTAPLDMMYYNGTALPMLTGKLLVSWHGYRVIGNRLVSYDVDAQGLPTLTPAKDVTFMRDPIAPATKFTEHAFNPKGGSAQDAQHTEIIHRWNKVDGVRPEGAPVGLLELSDGTLLIVDDKNPAILRLALGQSYIDTANENTDTNIEGMSFSGKVETLMNKHCAACHSELTKAPGVLLNRSAWLREENGQTILEARLQSNTRPMPPNQSLTNEQVQWIIDAID